MTARRLAARAVEKPWGRTDLQPCLADLAPALPIGEVLFEDQEEDDPELLVKFIFTSEPLSIQVHPNDAQARKRGFARGKDEAWLILNAGSESRIALGPLEPTTRDQLKRAVRQGRITGLLDWRSVQIDDFVYLPAGTIHAIGANITLLEIQQNVDLTYRLYDYGRARELHLEEGLNVATLTPFASPDKNEVTDILATGPKFVVERLTFGHCHRHFKTYHALLVVVTGEAAIDQATATQYQCWHLSGSCRIDIGENSTVILAYPVNRRLER